MLLMTNTNTTNDTINARIEARIAASKAAFAAELAARDRGEPSAIEIEARALRLERQARVAAWHAAHPESYGLRRR